MFSTVVSPFFANLINKSLFSCIFLNSLKIVKMTPLCKEGSMQNTSSYRPISLLSSPRKVFEKDLYSQLGSFLKKIMCFRPVFTFLAGCHNTIQAVMMLIKSVRESLGKKSCKPFLRFFKSILHGRSQLTSRTRGVANELIN